ncbi:DUF1330 domain-containing protein [Sphingobium cloacae]|uniref:DUF1330 domain-containing protein n=1 Tax=Sphingobium cloacae TaxID=120107 RepID=UPI00083795F0|nr:DUF1330 domain-containing protein [Sphingobium cloacae]
MAVYIVLAIEVADSETYKLYGDGAREILAGYNVEIVSGDGNPVVYEGTQPANHLSIVKFESQAEFERFFKSEEYQKILHYRRESSDTKFIMLMKGH